jgi:hypothetical protein
MSVRLSTAEAREPLWLSDPDGVSESGQLRWDGARATGFATDVLPHRDERLPTRSHSSQSRSSSSGGVGCSLLAPRENS